MPAVKDEWAADWPKICRDVQRIIKRRKIKFRTFAGEVCEEGKYGRLHSNIFNGRPPSGEYAIERVVKIRRWIGEHK